MCGTPTSVWIGCVPETMPSSLTFNNCLTWDSPSAIHVGHFSLFSMPNFYIRKHRPHGHRCGKALGCKDYFTANQLAKKCRKKKYDSIHDRYIRDKTFRKVMIEVGRFEQITKEVDWLASEDTLAKPPKKRLTYIVAIHTNVAHFDSHQQGTNLISKRRCRQCIASSKRRTKRNMPQSHNSLFFLAIACKLVGV